MSKSSSRTTQLKRTLARLALPFYVLTTVMTGVQLSSAPRAFAADSLFSDSFGTGSTDTTFDEAPVWIEDETNSEKRAPGSGNDSVSPDGGRFAIVPGNNGTLCTTVNAVGYGNVKLSYSWRGDVDANSSSDNAIVEVKPAAGKRLRK